MNRRQLLSAIPAVGALTLIQSRPAAAVGAGTYEDTDAALTYVGSWTPWSNLGNSGGSAKFSNGVAASVGLAFIGTSVAIVFLKQSNAGIASVSIDGVLVDSLDCYAPAQVFQQQKTYSVAQGAHTITIAVSGTHNPSATDNYFLLDAFIVFQPGVAGKRIQTTLDLVGQNPRAALALAGNASQIWGFGGDALSASERAVWFNQSLAPIVYARWVLIWNPCNSAAGVRLIQSDAGPANIVELGRIENSGSTTPIASALEVTSQLNNLAMGGVPKFVGHQEKGNGSQGPVVFSSALEIVWDLS